MTLIKEKPKRPTVTHRKRVGSHHRHSHMYLKTYWPYLPVISILLLGFVANSWLGQLHRSVLGYATDMSAQSLLDDTNVQRAQNGESNLKLNSELDAAAQAKASDMAARDYWSHNTPDGQTPWSFISAAGYEYATAGENLAYGFATAADTVTGWMNSPEHRANILNTTYQEVGFGIANIADYQGTGPETLIVAMYASPVVSQAPVAASAPAPKAAEPKPTLPSASIPAPAPVPVAQPDQQATATRVSTPAPAATSLTTKADTLEPSPVRVTQLQLVASNTPISATALAVLGLCAFAFLILRHSLAWRKVMVRGESFALHHPALDITAISLVSLAIVLSHTAGLIR